jgi:uncharacterized protein YndB with AHSA1/START domain
VTTMPSFADSAVSAAPPEEVWKLLYDPSRIPEWWAGIATVAPSPGGVTLYADGYPDFPMPQLVTTTPGERGIRFSCQVSEIRMDWQLSERGDGGTNIAVEIEIPAREAHRLATQRAEVAASILRLAELAALSGG